MALVSLRFRHNRRLQAAAANSPSMKVAEQDTDAVRILQQALHDVIRPNGSFGYPMPLTFKSGGPDGVYGNETFTAVVSFQKERFHEDRRAHDGQAGKRTLRGVRSALSRRRPGPSGSHYTRRTNTERSAAASAAVKLRQVADAIHALTNQDRHFDDAAPVHVVVLHDSIQMAIIEREPTRTLQASVDRAIRTLPGAVRAVVNGIFRCPYVARRGWASASRSVRPQRVRRAEWATVGASRHER